MPILKISYYRDNLDWNTLHECSIHDPKKAVTELGSYMLKYKPIRFEGSIPYIKLKDHYERISADDLPDLLRNLIAPADRLSVSSASIEESIKRIKSDKGLQIDFEKYSEKQKYEINLLNGVYDTKTKKLRKLEESDCFNYRLNFNYIPEDKRKLDTFDYYVKTSIGEANRDCLLRIIGAVLSSIRDIKKAFIILGGKNSGKSIVLEFIERAVGKQYVTSQPFHEIGTKGAIASYTGGIRVNLSRDVTRGLIRADAGFKSVISCEEIIGRRLYENSSPVVPKVIFVAASNLFPRFKDPDDACLDRLIVMKIKGYEGELDRELPGKLFAELDAVCSLAVDTLKDFVDSGYDFCMSEESKEILAHEFQKLHTVQSFIEENYTICNDGEVSSVKLSDHYVRWCNDNNFEPIGKKYFHEELKSLYPSLEYKKVRDGNKRVWGFKGLLSKKNLSKDDDFTIQRKS